LSIKGFMDLNDRKWGISAGPSTGLLAAPC
jgi:hypothetical protein